MESSNFFDGSGSHSSNPPAVKEISSLPTDPKVADTRNQIIQEIISSESTFRESTSSTEGGEVDARDISLLRAEAKHIIELIPAYNPEYAELQTFCLLL